jgi:hypothetical protein
MPTRPASSAQLRFVHAAANRGEGWAKKTVGEWHGKTFGKLPKTVRHKIGRKRGKP